MNNKRKIGRNEPCFCGSGLKYKKCCLLKSSQSEIPLEIIKIVEEHRKKEIINKQKYGEVRPLIHSEFKDKKLVAVGSRLYYADKDMWNTFSDFLMSYIIDTIGRDWWKNELNKPLEQRHQILKWYDTLIKNPGIDIQVDKDRVKSCIPNGNFAAYLLLAYDLYILRHHIALQSKVLRRLRDKIHFQGARYELFVAATCCRAGFEIDYEDEQDPSCKHPEFIATHKRTGQKVSVEAKSRHRPGILDYPGEKINDNEIKVGINALLRNALEKPTNNPFIIFIDLNLPPSPEKVFEKPWFTELHSSIDVVAGDVKKAPDKFNLIVFTNHPHHYGKDFEPDPAKDCIGLLSPHPVNIPEHPEVIFKIYDAVFKYGNIPNEFPEEQVDG